MNEISDMNRVGRNFHRQAGEYDRHAVVQKRVVESLTRLVASHCASPPQRALDIGCGTGAMLIALRKLYPLAGLYGLDLAFNMTVRANEQLRGAAVLVNGDAEILPFGARSFELLVSASTLQWVDGLDACFQECLRVLRPGGLLCAAFFGGGTLWELQESYRAALVELYDGDRGHAGRLRRFRDCHDVRRALDDAGFDQVVVSSETEIEYHTDVAALLRAIKGVGATTPARTAGVGGLGWRGVLNAMSANYQGRFQRNGKIPATYDVIYLVARKGHAS